jgi:DNA processing protein
MEKKMDEKVYWMGFNLVKGIGAVRFQNLINFFGSLEVAWQAPAEALASAGLSQKTIENLVLVRKSKDLQKIWDHLQAQGIQVLTWQDAAYPSVLKEIDQPPPVLYLRGSFVPEDGWAVAIVGTRRITPYGRQVADELAAYLAYHGLTVVSGLARGVDAVAHEAALKAGGRTIAVLGSGIDIIYPPENKSLAEQVVKQGALISDYPPGTQPEGVNFPPRNRIISGLARATVVVEAGEKSGALITATFAAEQGREVLAVPGTIHAPQSKGTNHLIQQGARPLLAMQDVLEAIDFEHVQEHYQARTLFPSDEKETTILRILSDEPLSMDEIGIQANLPIEQVSSTLVLMELKGMVSQVGGMSYVAVHEEQGEYLTGNEE